MLYSIYLTHKNWGADLIASTYDEDALHVINPSNLVNHSRLFPNVNINDVYDYLNRSYISLDLVNNAKQVITIVQTHYPVSIGRDQYLALLKIMVGDDVDIKPFTNGRYIPTPLVSMAWSVLNGKVLKQIIPIQSKVLSINKIIPSEVLYDLSYYNKLGYDRDIKIEISSYLSTNHLYTNQTVNDSPILMILGLTKFDIALIDDPETALRLSTVTDVELHLNPLTQFSFDLMQQFGLKPKRVFMSK